MGADVNPDSLSRVKQGLARGEITVGFFSSLEFIGGVSATYHPSDKMYRLPNDKLFRDLDRATLLHESVHALNTEVIPSLNRIHDEVSAYLSGFMYWLQTREPWVRELVNKPNNAGRKMLKAGIGIIEKHQMLHKRVVLNCNDISELASKISALPHYSRHINEECSL